MLTGIVRANFAEAFRAQFAETASDLGEFSSIDAAGKAAMSLASVKKDNVGVASTFCFDGFVKGIRGVVIAGVHGYVAFIEDRDTIISKSYSGLNVWSEIETLSDVIEKLFAHGKDLSTWVIALDTAMTNYSRGSSMLTMLHDNASHTLKSKPRKVA